jgi:hypothetical protein
MVNVFINVSAPTAMVGKAKGTTMSIWKVLGISLQTILTLEPCSV